MADLCGRLNWKTDAVGSMRLIRSSVFGSRYDELKGLCDLESAAAFRHPNSFAMVLGYRVFREAIQAQLDDALRRVRAGQPVVEEAAKDA